MVEQLVSEPSEHTQHLSMKFAILYRHCSWGPKTITIITSKITDHRDFPGGAVVKDPPANAGDTGSSPSPGRSHMSWSN